MPDDPKYANEYELPYPDGVEYPYPRMPMRDRAAQFAAFKALTGYEDAVDEAARLTDAKIELDEGALDLLNAKMQILQEQLAAQPEVTVTYFLPDEKKAGGRYVAFTGRLLRIDDVARRLVFEGKKAIPTDDILALDGAVFAALNAYATGQTT